MVAQAQKIITHDVGRQGEDAAADFFREQGYAVVARNWRCRGGEIDLIVRKGSDVRVVEVKTRRGPHRGPLGPHETVTDRKLAKIGTAMGLFFGTHPGLPHEVHIDVVSILLMPDGTVQVEWLKDFE